MIEDYSKKRDLWYSFNFGLGLEYFFPFVLGLLPFLETKRLRYLPIGWPMSVFVAAFWDGLIPRHNIWPVRFGLWLILRFMFLE